VRKETGALFISLCLQLIEPVSVMNYESVLIIIVVLLELEAELSSPRAHGLLPRTKSTAAGVAWRWIRLEDDYVQWTVESYREYPKYSVVVTKRNE
jgi:hypothetical protein